MKKHELKEKAIRNILDEFKTALDYANDNSLRYKRSMVTSQCDKLYGFILAYRYIGLLSHNEYVSLCTLETNIEVYHNIFGGAKNE